MILLFHRRSEPNSFSVFDTTRARKWREKASARRRGRRRGRRETIFRSYRQLGYEVARFATAQFSTRADKIRASTHGHLSRGVESAEIFLVVPSPPRYVSLIPRTVISGCAAIGMRETCPWQTTFSKPVREREREIHRRGL